MMLLDNANFLKVMAKASQDGDYMKALVADPATTLAAAGVETGGLPITIDLDNPGHALTINVGGTGVNWKGALTLNMTA